MRQALPLVILASLVASCMKGPGFMKQGGAGTLTNESSTEAVVVATRDENGAATGSVSASSDKTQVVQASANSQIAGSAVEFPPGSLAVDTEVTIKQGESVADDATIAALGLDTTVAAAGAPVVVESSVQTDATQPFTVAIPIPDSSGLRLTDPYENLVVIYRIEKVGEGQAYSGVLTRELLDIATGYARFATRHFGTFQAAYTVKRVVKPVEVVAEPKAVVVEPKPEPKPEPEPEPVPEQKPRRRHYYATGFMTTTFATEGQAADGYLGWLLPATPAKVGQATTMTTGFVTKWKEGE